MSRAARCPGRRTGGRSRPGRGAFCPKALRVLLHDDRLWGSLDSWMSGLSDEAFTRILPFIRRSSVDGYSDRAPSAGEAARGQKGVRPFTLLARLRGMRNAPSGLFGTLRRILGIER